MQYDRRPGRRYERRRPGKPNRQDDGTFRGQVRLHAPLDRHVAQRPQGARGLQAIPLRSLSGLRSAPTTNRAMSTRFTMPWPQ